MQKKHTRNGLNYKGAINDKVNITFAVTEKSIRKIKEERPTSYDQMFPYFQEFLTEHNNKPIDVPLYILPRIGEQFVYHKHKFAVKDVSHHYNGEFTPFICLLCDAVVL